MKQKEKLESKWGKSDAKEDSGGRRIELREKIERKNVLAIKNK